MKLPKIREIGEALRSIFSRSYAAKFPFAPIIPEGLRGRTKFFEEDCVGCLACLEVCPARAIEYVDDPVKKLRTLTHHQDICIYCQQCEKACITTKGIRLTKEWDMTTTDRKAAITQSKKELVICDSCGEVVAPLEHLMFLATKVGHLLYANPTLILARHKELDLLSAQLPSKSPHKRAGHLTMLCPNCRREMIIKEQW